MTRYRFSAFWLRSSVVSVLISLISDTSSIRGQYIKWIFGAGSWNRSLLRPLHASTWYCSTSRNGAPPTGNNLCHHKGRLSGRRAGRSGLGSRRRMLLLKIYFFVSVALAVAGACVSWSRLRCRFATFGRRAVTAHPCGRPSPV